MIKYNSPTDKKEYKKLRKNWNKTYNNPNRPYKEIEFDEPKKKNKGIGCIIVLLVIILLLLIIPYIFTAGLLVALNEALQNI